jgi:hypothetical protein
MVQMRRMAVAAAAAALLGAGAALAADDEKPGTGERVLGGVISGLLGTPQQASDAAYTAQERERLAALLTSGDYATSRQGEPIDMVVLGIPLTRAEHVYSAKPVPPSRASR